MGDLISRLSEIRSEYNCFDENEEPYYRALSEAIKILSRRADWDTISRQAAIDAMCVLMHYWFGCDSKDEIREIKQELGKLPSAQPDVPDINVGDMVSRKAAIDAINGLIDRFEQILRDIRETKIDDSVCGMCEYDGAYMGQSGDWCNECPGFEKDDCFKLSEKCKKRWLDSVELPSAQPDTSGNTSETQTKLDCISRRDAIDALMKRDKELRNINWYDKPFAEGECKGIDYALEIVNALPSAQPERKNGKWVWKEDEIDWGLGAWCCSEYGRKPETWWESDKRNNPLRCAGSKFCGNCGVYMIGEEDEHND